MKTKESLDSLTNLTKVYTLLLLSEKPKHGYEIIKALESKLKKKVSAANVYPFLKKLEGSGYISSKTIEGREKKVYRLTSEGKVFVRKILAKFDNIIELAIAPKLTQCAHCGCEVYKGSYIEKIGGKTLAFCCCSCASSYKKG